MCHSGWAGKPAHLMQARAWVTDKGLVEIKPRFWEVPLRLLASGSLGHGARGRAEAQATVYFGSRALAPQSGVAKMASLWGVACLIVLCGSPKPTADER